jgi:hypothetical protein
MSDRDQFSKQVDLLVSSHALHGSGSLCKLLRYLAQHALDDPGARLKEYQIATEVFGRPVDFDPQLDSMIRVQAGRLRAKLAEYYSSDGVDDSIIVELPKGSYHLEFHRRHPNAGRILAISSNGSNRRERISPRSLRNWKILAVTLGVLLVVSLTAIALLSRHKVAPTVLAGTVDEASTELQQLWKPFITGPQEPWLIFSNAAFIGRPETGMRYYSVSRDVAGPIWDHYTGVGEVLAVHELDDVFGSLHRQIRVKRGSLFSLDDVKNNDLIFLGSPSENLTLTEIPNTREFVFQRITDGPRKGDLGIVNVHPQGDEQRVFLASPYASPLTEDYALIAFMPGMDPVRSVMIFAGTTTFGTQAAAEYACHRNSVKELLSRLTPSKSGGVKPFEALLHVKVRHGVPVETELLAVRQ